MQGTLNGADRQARDFHNIFKRELLFISQCDQFRIIRPQLANGLVQHRSQFMLFCNAIWRFRIASLLKTVLRHLLERRSSDTTSPHFINGGMMGNRQEPSRKLPFRRIGLQPKKSFHECVLRQLLRARRIANHPEYHGKDRPLITPNQLMKGTLRAGKRASNQISISFRHSFTIRDLQRLRCTQCCAPMVGPLS